MDSKKFLKAGSNSLLYVVDPQKLSLSTFRVSVEQTTNVSFTTDHECFNVNYTSYEDVDLSKKLLNQKTPVEINGKYYFNNEEQALDFLHNQMY